MCLSVLQLTICVCLFYRYLYVYVCFEAVSMYFVCLRLSLCMCIFPISLCVCLIYSYLYVFVYFTAISMHVCFYSNLYGLFARNFEEWMVLVLSDCVRWSGKTSSLTKIVFGITSFARQKFKPNGPLHLRGPNVIEFGEILPLW